MTVETAPNGDRIVAQPHDAQPAMDVIITTGPLLQAANSTFTFYNDTGRPLRLRKVRAFTTVALTTADSVITVENAAAESLGDLTITQSSSAVADEDSLDIDQYHTNSPIIADGEFVGLDHDGGPDAGEAYFQLVLTPCIDGVS